MEKERDMRYEKFQTTGQERVRLACALEGFFLTNECEEEKKTAYGQYGIFKTMHSFLSEKRHFILADY